MKVAIVGCGQLARMLALAGIPMGLQFSFLGDPEEDARCVEGLGPVARWQPDVAVEDIYAQLGKPERITVEKEQVDVAILEQLQRFCPVHPNPQAFAACQHRHREKELLDQLGIPCASYSYGMPDNSPVPLPVVVKSCREGYDGKNQWVLRSEQDVAKFSQQAAEEAYIVEQLIPFDREISQVSARAADGTIHHYPLAENHHHKGILKQSIVPAPEASEKLIAMAQHNISRVMEALNYVGVIAMECFVVGDELLVNELAPRVHNSGHWSQNAGVTSQFENHLRALVAMPLGVTHSLGVTGMVNLIGIEQPAPGSLTAQSSLHWYGKTVRPGRKLGHINVMAKDHADLQQQLQLLKASTGLA